ncbi:hypothetical protein LSG25_13050 [Paralcaligenes sp. KSB-10]|uniref:hypothetical protein n=1 Tax=Paralcaligenes sp. KSB-10 TaxID=2901142 RepID=UPI001E399B66|nr:hypothetical protein [Paralcaligenes sp. KSB-10]UHL62997.1 hypothetical protein LSG25_13050 [Paralcaligenes sp. KSB-10]
MHILLQTGAAYIIAGHSIPSTPGQVVKAANHEWVSELSLAIILSIYDGYSSIDQVDSEIKPMH